MKDKGEFTGASPSSLGTNNCSETACVEDDWYLSGYQSSVEHRVRRRLRSSQTTKPSPGELRPEVKLCYHSQTIKPSPGELRPQPKLCYSQTTNPEQAAGNMIRRIFFQERIKPACLRMESMMCLLRFVVLHNINPQKINEYFNCRKAVKITDEFTKSLQVLPRFVFVHAGAISTNRDHAGDKQHESYVQRTTSNEMPVQNINKSQREKAWDEIREIVEYVVELGFDITEASLWPEESAWRLYLLVILYRINPCEVDTYLNDLLEQKFKEQGRYPEYFAQKELKAKHDQGNSTNKHQNKLMKKAKQMGLPKETASSNEKSKKKDKSKKKLEKTPKHPNTLSTPNRGASGHDGEQIINMHDLHVCCRFVYSLHDSTPPPSPPH